MRLTITTFLTTVLLMQPAIAADPSACLTGSDEERLTCLTRTHCPAINTEQNLTSCYRHIVLMLLNSESLPSAANQPLETTAENLQPEPTPRPMPTQPDSTAPEVASEENFGYSWQQAQQRQETLNEISSKIVYLETLARGNYLIGLENGQLWTQIAKSRTRLKLGETVRISRGSLRSFRLIPEKSTSTNVSRVVCHGDQASTLCSAFERTVAGSEPDP